MDEIQSLVSEGDPESRFDLLEVLGQGSYGCVYKSLDKLTGQLYAIKILELTSSAEMTAVKKQIGILKECDDDHIVRYYGAYFKDNHLWIVIEYCAVGSITDIIQITGKKFNQNQIATILQSALLGLDYIHSRKKVHRDIKASNILLDQKGNAKLADFGVSASAAHSDARFRTYIGSPYWMSPEILNYHTYNNKTDIWSLGMTAIQIAEGQVPNAHLKPFMVTVQMKTKPVQSFKQPELWSQQFNDFVRQCLTIQPSLRPQAKQLLKHPFIIKNTKGPRLLTEIFYNSLAEIQEFRTAQSRNNSFQLVIPDTVVDKNYQSRSNVSQKQVQAEEQQNSMIVLDSARSNTHSYTGSVIVNDNIQQQQNQKSKKTQNNVLASYVNGMKNMHNVQIKYAQKLIQALNNYDRELQEQINKMFDEYKQKVERDIKNLQELKISNPIIDESFICRINLCHDVKQFIHPFIDCVRESGSNLQINSRDKIEQNKIKNEGEPQRYTQSTNSNFLNKNTQSTVEKQKFEASIYKDGQNRKQSRSFAFNNNNRELASVTQPFKKSFPFAYTCLQETGQSEPNILNKPNGNKHNSSRMMFGRHDNVLVPSMNDRDNWMKLQQFKNDPDVMSFIKKQFLNHQSVMTHTKSNFQPNNTYIINKTTTQGLIREQRSTEQSMSKSKNKSLKNLKSKKMKTRI